MRPRRRPALCSPAAAPSLSKSCRPISCTNQTLAAYVSNLTSERAVREAATDILARARLAKPDARITGVTIHPMILRPKARELIAGIADDPTFGPIVVFGSGGTAVEVIDDKAIGLPPLDMKLAYDLIARTRISRLLKPYRNVPAADIASVAAVLVKLAQLAADLPEIHEVDLNPLLADENGVITVDARVAIAPVDRVRRMPSGHPRFAICPYPKEWERHTTLKNGTAIFIRPIRPDDERLYPPFLARVSQEDLRLRFFAPVKKFDHAFIARFTQLDYARAMAFVAIDEVSGEMLGVARLHANSTYDTAEYAVLVRSDLKGRGLGWLLMQIIIEYARSEGLQIIEGQVLEENVSMLRMCAELGFAITPDPSEPHISIVRLALSCQAARGVLTILRLPFCIICAASNGAPPFPAKGTLRSRRDLMSKIMIVVGHPQRTTFCEALGRAYARGALLAATKRSCSISPR